MKERQEPSAFDNFEQFKFFGGDMEVLLSRCKRAHARRIFASKTGIKKEIDMIDMKRGFDSFKAHRMAEIKVESDLWKTMYI